MRFKRLLALLLAAALALSLLAGCGGGKNQSLSQMLLNLLDGQYQNVSVEIDSDLEAKLRQAISESETDEELRAALEQLLGGGISFQRLGSGQQGDSAWTLIIYPGTDPDAAARSVYLDLDKVFAALPADGVYSSGFAMAEMENGYAILVKATVDKAGTEDKPDPVTLESIKVTKNPKLEYWVGESFDPTGMVITATYSNNTTKTLKDIKENGNQGVKWTPDGALTTSDTSITITYGGKTTTVSVTVNVPTVESLTVEPASLSYTAGATFDPKALGTITATYTNNKTENVQPENCEFYLDGTRIDSSTPFTTAGNYTLKVSYKGGTTEIPLTVGFGTVARITVSGPNKKEYELNEPFDSTGLKVTAYDGYGNSKTVTTGYTITITDEENKEVNLSNPFTTAGSYTLTVEYNGIISNSITITVVDKGYTDDGEGNYTVTTAEGLKAVADIANNGNLGINITLTGNIDLKGIDWTPIGTASNNAYTGTFDGNGHTITGLTVNQEGTKYVGLIGFIGSNGTVKNVKLENVNITGSFYVGGVVGGNYGTVIACTSSGNVSGNTYVGGVVGDNYGTVTACTASGSVKGSFNVGGVVGYNSRGSVTACTSSGSVEGSRDVGGVVGDNYGTVTACYWSGSPNAGIGSGKQKDDAEYNGTDHNNMVGSDWTEAVKAMNAALQSAGCEWRYELTGTLPTLKKRAYPIICVNFLRGVE